MVRAILAIGCLIAGSVCITGSYVVAAVMTMSLTSGSPIESFQQHIWRSHLPLTIGGMFLAIGTMLAVSALIREQS